MELGFEVSFVVCVSCGRELEGQREGKVLGLGSSVVIDINMKKESMIG